MHDLTGLKIGDLTVLYRSGSNRQGLCKWLCQCKCGIQKAYSSDHLTRKKDPVLSCGCRVKRIGRDNPLWKGCGDISGKWWSNHVTRERKQTTRVKIPVTITIEEAWNLYLFQEGKCALSGLPIIIRNSRYGTASLDRIDSS